MRSRARPCLSLARVVRRRENRLAWGLITAGLLVWAAGDLVWTLWLNNLANPPYPSSPTSSIS